MEGFQKIILLIATIILIISLLFIGYALHRSSASSTSWPPLVPDCPDYWNIDGSGNNITCTNVKDLGTCRAKTGQPHLVMNFNTPAFSGSNSLCAKYTWANNCGVSWDGVNYGVNNPCQK